MLESNKNQLKDEARVYESILENLPHDRFALEKLHSIYLLLDDKIKVQDCADRLKFIEVGEINPDDYQANPQSLINKAKNFFNKDSSISELINESSKTSISFFDANKEIWMSNRAHIELLIRMYEKSFLDSESYIKLCNNLKLAEKSNDHLWKGVVGHFPDCDKLSYESLLEYFQEDSAMQYVDLSHFRPSKELEVLPKKLISHCELIIFSLSILEVSVAMLNPYNNQVKKLLEEYFTLPVKFYLTDVESFNTFVKGR